MGLFDYVSSIGERLFGDDEDEAQASEKIKAHVEADNPGVENLEVSLDDGVATLKGSAEDQAALEKAVLLAGNVLGVSEVKADELSTPAVQAAAPPDNTVYYDIKSGDTLWAIAQEHYGDGNKYQQIFEANREVIKDPDKIYPGQKIRIPAA